MKRNIVIENCNTTNKLRNPARLTMPLASDRFKTRIGLKEAKKNAGAIEAFKYYVEIYPDSAAAHACLGEAYEENGQLELAKEHYEISLKLAIKNKDNLILPSARGLLKRLLKKMEDK